MKKLLISVLVISFMLVGCSNSKDLPESDSIGGTDTSTEIEEPIEEEPVSEPAAEDTESEPVEEVPEDLITFTYETYGFCVSEFNLTDGVLTVVADDGSGSDWDIQTPFSFSYPVSEECTWQIGYFEYQGGFTGEDNDYEHIKEWIASERETYEYLLSGGETSLDSPIGVHVDVVDSIVIRVYITAS